MNCKLMCEMGGEGGGDGMAESDSGEGGKGEMRRWWSGGGFGLGVQGLK